MLFKSEFIYALEWVQVGLPPEQQELATWVADSVQNQPAKLLLRCKHVKMADFLGSSR